MWTFRSKRCFRGVSARVASRLAVANHLSLLFKTLYLAQILSCDSRHGNVWEIVRSRRNLFHQFPDAVQKATGERPQLPPRLADLLTRTERVDGLTNDVAALKALIDDRMEAAEPRPKMARP